MKKTLAVLGLFLSLMFYGVGASADDGYRLWLKYDLVSNPQKLEEYRQTIKAWMVEGNSSTMEAAKHELRIGLDGLLGSKIPEVEQSGESELLLAGTYRTLQLPAGIDLQPGLDKIGPEGFLILTEKIAGKNVTVILYKAALHRLRPRKRVHRYQRRSAQQR